MKTASYYSKFKTKKIERPQIEVKDSIGQEMIRTRFRTK